MLYDPPEVHPLLWEGVSGSCGWDIGAAIGNTLGEMISRFDQVYAFEPHTLYFNQLAELGPISKVTMYKLAISNYNGKIHLPTPGKVPCRSIDSLVNKVKMPDFIKVDVEGHEYNV